jgi:predicted SnoaL-like aldol condensation-catalyzing enzyme
MVTMDVPDPHLRGEERVREVFARVHRGDDSVADLYAPDGVVLAGGARIEGRPAIRAFYADTIATIHPKPEVREVLTAPGSDLFAVIVEVPTDRGHMHALDLFRVDDGGIRQLEIFNRAIE